MTDDELKAQFAGQALIATGHLITYDRVLQCISNPAEMRHTAEFCWMLAEAMLDARPVPDLPAADADDVHPEEKTP